YLAQVVSNLLRQDIVSPQSPARCVVARSQAKRHLVCNLRQPQSGLLPLVPDRVMAVEPLREQELGRERVSSHFLQVLGFTPPEAYLLIDARFVLEIEVAEFMRGREPLHVQRPLRGNDDAG